MTHSPSAQYSGSITRSLATLLQRETVRYALVGVSGLVVDLVALVLLFEVVGLPLLWANAISFSLAVTNNYLLNRHWTFGRRRQHRSTVTAPLFLTAALVGLGINELGLLLLTDRGVNYLIAKLLVIGVVVIWNFSFNSLITFRNR